MESSEDEDELPPVSKENASGSNLEPLKPRGEPNLVVESCPRRLLNEYEPVPKRQRRNPTPRSTQQDFLDDWDSGCE